MIEYSMSFNLLSIGLGLLAWSLPVIYLCIKKRREFFTCGSLLCVVFSLYFQIRELTRLVQKPDLSAVLDTITAVCFCATVLTIFTLAVNAIALTRKKS